MNRSKASRTSLPVGPKAHEMDKTDVLTKQLVASTAHLKTKMTLETRKSEGDKARLGGHTLKEFQEKNLRSSRQVSASDVRLQDELRKVDHLMELSTKSFDGGKVELSSEELSTEQFDKVYQSALSSVVNVSGRLPREAKEYERYLQEACGMRTEKHQVLRRRALHEVAELRLHVSVVEAKDLISKDNDGLSDPYCIMAMVHEKEVKKPHKDIHHWEKKKVVHTVWQTKVVPKTLTPVWNQDFETLILDTKAEFLAVEIWDSDEESASVMKSVGIEGIKNYLQDLRGKDDFLGKVYIPLAEIDFKGLEKWYPLVSHKGNPRGSIKLSLQIHSKLPFLDEDSAITFFCQFYRLLVSYERRVKGEFGPDWNGDVDPLGQDLLNLFAARSSVKKLHQAVCKLKILYRETITCPAAILCFMETIRDNREDLEEATRAKPPKQWVGSLMKAMTMLSKEVLELLKRHQNFVTLKTGENVCVLKNHLLLLKTIYQVDSYLITLDKNTANLQLVVTIALQTSCVFWYQKLVTTPLASVEGSQKLIVTVAAIKGMICFLSRAESQLSAIFEELGVSYFDVVYADIDRQLAADIEDIVVQVDKRHSKDLYLLYQEIATFAAMKQQLRTVDPNMLKLRGYYTLFKPLVSVWIDERMKDFEEGMWKAVKSAEAVPVLQTVKYSTAVRDTIKLMIRVCGFLKGLNWQDPEEFVSFLLLIIQQICDKVLKFVNYISTKLKKNSYYLRSIKKNKLSLKMVSEELCVHLNDIQQLRTGLKDIPNYLDWETQRQSISSTNTEGAVSRVYETIATLLYSTDEDMDHEMIKVYTDISMALRESVVSVIQNVVSPKLILEKEIECLFDYLTELLAMLFQGLFVEVFKGLLESIWNVVVDAIEEVLRMHSSEEVAGRLFQISGGMLSFFNSGGEGLAEDVMKTKKYQTLVHQLELTIDKTETVISTYLMDLVDYQSQHYGTRGTLTFSIGYNQDEQVLEVTIIKANDLPKLDFRNKSSDPFVIIELNPKLMFASVKTEKTAVHKTTLDPVFNEDFKIHVPRGHLHKPGAVVFFQVYDYDIFSSNDLMGVVVVAGKDIPCFNASLSSNLLAQSGRLTKTQPLFIPLETQAFRELRIRASHKNVVAYDFLKKMKKLM